MLDHNIPQNHKTILNFTLHSTHSYKVFLEKRPKHLSKLEIDPNIATVYNSEKTKRILQDLIKLTRKSPNIKAIQYISLLKHFRARTSQAVFIMKRVHRVESLGVMWDFYNETVQKETRLWLKFLNKLRSLSFRYLHFRTAPKVSTIKSFKELNLRLLRDIYQRKITRLIHSPVPGYEKMHYHTLDMRYYPSSMQEISLDLNNCAITLDDKHVEKLISMDKFSLLMRLELLFCLELNMALMILRSIPHPQILTSLGLYLRNFPSKHEEQSLISIFEFIKSNCIGIDKLDLRLTHPTEKLKILGSLQNNLRVLNLWVSAKIERHLQDIGCFLLTTKDLLESLDLKINFDMNSVLSKENFCELYKSLGQLAQLRKLRLNFSPNEKAQFRPEYIQYYKAPPSYPALMKSIACLSRLEELCLYIPDTESELKAHQLGEALSGLAHQLKKLEMDFYGQSLDAEGGLGFLNVLRKMKELGELCVSRFSVTRQKSFLDFKEALESLHKVEKVVLKSFEIPLKGGGEALNEMVVFLLMKKGLKELRVKHNFQGNVRKGKKEMNFSEILNKNPELRLVSIESPNIWYPLYNNKLESLNYV